MYKNDTQKINMEDILNIKQINILNYWYFYNDYLHQGGIKVLAHGESRQRL